MAKIYRVVRIKRNQLVQENVLPIRDHRLTNKGYLSAVTVADISRSFYLEDGGKNQLA